MAEQIPLDHPRRKSLLEREKIFEAFKEGLLAPVATIAHGRGEAFDYLINEKTTESAFKAIKIASNLLINAKKPVLSVNGNTAVLAKDDLLSLAVALNCIIEVNIFYRTKERMRNLLKFFENDKGVKILGENPDAFIPNLSSERAKCCKEGIYSSDVVFVPLEDGDRCEALRKMGKIVIVVDLNPFSRSARTASLTIVDNITRCVKELTKEILMQKNNNITQFSFNNNEILSNSVDEILNRIIEFKKNPSITI